METPAELIEEVADLIVKSKKIVVFTGAGVSTESGIPDFRSPGGIWTKYKPEDFTYQKFMTSPETRRLTWQRLKESSMLFDAQPNPAHYAAAELERMGKLDCVITQNVDNLHQKAGNSEEKVIELHGTYKWVRCLNCGKRYPMEEIRKRVMEGVEVPDCDDCHGTLKPATISFGEAMPVWETQEAEHRSRNCDLFIVIGSSLVVHPAAYMPVFARQSGAKLVIINISPTPMDDDAWIRIYAKAGETMSKVMERVRAKMGSA